MPAPAIGISIPTLFDLTPLDEAGGVAAAARHIEQLGFDSVSVPDLITGDGTPSLEATLVLAAAAAATVRVRLEIGVLALPLRPVAWVATQVATLQYLSGNRLVLGVGAGGFPDAPFWSALGVPGRERGRRTDAALDVLPRLLAGEPTVRRDGSDEPAVSLAPAVPVPPIVIGGHSEVSLRRTVEYGDGWAPSIMTTETLAGWVRRLRGLAAEHGRTTPRVRYGTHAMAGDGAAVRSARDTFVGRLADMFGMTGEDAERIPLSGTPRQLAESLHAYAEAGADSVNLAIDGPNWMRQCETVAEARALLDGA